MRRLPQVLSLCLLAACSDSQQEIEQALRIHLVNGETDRSVTDVAILYRDESDAVVRCRLVQYEPGRTYGRGIPKILHLKRAPDGWRLDRDLVKDFARAATAELKEPIRRRLEARLEERYGEKVPVQGEARLGTTVDVRGGRVVGKVQIGIVLRLSENRFRHITYIETHHYEPGRWVHDSSSLLERVGG